MKKRVLFDEDDKSKKLKKAKILLLLFLSIAIIFSVIMLASELINNTLEKSKIIVYCVSILLSVSMLFPASRIDKGKEG